VIFGSRGPRGRVPKHPYRDTAIVNAVLACLLLLIAWLTGGDMRDAAFVAVAFFLIATAWSWWRFRRRIAEEDAELRRPPE
jgi:hypothetical protein